VRDRHARMWHCRKFRCRSPAATHRDTCVRLVSGLWSDPKRFGSARHLPGCGPSSGLGCALRSITVAGAVSVSHRLPNSPTRNTGWHRTQHYPNRCFFIGAKAILIKRCSRVACDLRKECAGQDGHDPFPPQFFVIFVAIDIFRYQPTAGPYTNPYGRTGGPQGPHAFQFQAASEYVCAVICCSSARFFCC
jgi:hypothetical protein